MKVSSHSDFVPELIDEWFELLSKNNRYRIQQHPIWIDGYIRHYLQSKNFKLLIVRDDEGRLLCGLFLQQISKRFYKLFSYKVLQDLGCGVNDFFNAACKPGFESSCAKVIAGWFIAHSSTWERLQLSFVPESNIFEKELIEAFKERFEVQVRKDRAYYKINTEQPWESYFTAERNQKLRDVRGRVNRAIRNGYDVKLTVLTEDIEKHFENFLDHFAKRRERKAEKNSYANPAKVSLMKEVMWRCQPLGSIQMSLLEDQFSEVWAYQLDLIDREQGIWYHYAPAFNERFQEFSPSKILLFETLKYAFQDPGIKEFNFMRGEADYKKQFTDDFEYYVQLDVVNRFSYKVKFHHLVSALVISEK